MSKAVFFRVLGVYWVLHTLNVSQIVFQEALQEFRNILRMHIINGMLRHAFLRVGEDISLQNIMLPPFTFCSVCLSILFFACQHE